MDTTRLSKDHIVNLVSSRKPGDLIRVKVRRETLTETTTRNFTLTRDIGTGNTRNLFLDRSCTYRLRLDDLTYAKAFMIGLDKQDSEQAYGVGILGNGAGEGDLVIRFGEITPIIFSTFALIKKELAVKFSLRTHPITTNPISVPTFYSPSPLANLPSTTKYWSKRPS